MEDNNLNTDPNIVPEQAEATVNEAATAESTAGVVPERQPLGEAPVIQPSPGFQIEEEPDEPTIEETEDNVEIGSSHLETEHESEESAPIEPEQSVIEEPETTPAEEAPINHEPEVTPAANPTEVITPVTGQKKTNKTLIIVAAILAVACAGIIVFALIKK